MLPHGPEQMVEREEVIPTSDGPTNNEPLQAYVDSMILGPVDLTDVELLQVYADSLDNLDAAKQIASRLEQEIYARMEREGATGIPSEAFVCELRAKDSYDQARFTPFKEILNDADLAEVLTLGHMSPPVVPYWIEDSWATNKLKAMCKRYGTKAKKAFEAAKLPGRARLQFSKREEADVPGGTVHESEEEGE